MDSNLLSEYIAQFLTQQKCFRHNDRRAKLIRVSTSLSDTFICSECMEMEVGNSGNLCMTIKRAIDTITNFISFDKLNTKVQTQQSFESINNLKTQLSTFYGTFKDLLSNIETKLTLRQDICDKHKINCDKKLFDIQRSVNNYYQMKKLKEVDINRKKDEQVFTNTLTHSIIILLQNQPLVSTCNYDKQQKIEELFNNSLQLVKTLMSEQYIQLQSLIDSEEKLLNLINDQTEQTQLAQTKTTKLFETFQSTKSQMFNSVVSSYSSSVGLSLQTPWLFKPESIHNTFKLQSPTKLHIPYDPNNVSIQPQLLRLALIGPRIQEGPLKQPRQITFEIESQVKSVLCVGICNISQKNSELNLINDNRPYIMFSSLGRIICNDQEQVRYASPIFTRGDTISIVLKPQTNYIQVIKNKLYNQPFHFELQNEKDWQWTNLVFAVAAYGQGGGDISIIPVLQ